MNIAIYARVSTKEQNVENQLSQLRQFCRNRGFEVYGEYVDEGQSGTSEKRPAFSQLLADARKAKFNCVLVWKLDRFSRSLQHLLNVLSELKNRNVDFISYSQDIDTTTPTGKLLFHIMGAFCEFERDLIAERVRRGKQRSRRKQGRKPKRVDVTLIRKLYEKLRSYRRVAAEYNRNKYSKNRVSYGLVAEIIKGSHVK
jgi:DNA invertase Pin-like site-specific DNA recombinase